MGRPKVQKKRRRLAGFWEHLILEYELDKAKLEQIREIVNNLAATSANLEQLSAAVNQRPSLLLWGSPPKAPTPKPTPAKRR